MAAAVALSNYQLGDLLGRGASGSVYRALNFLTGETVAIKSVSLLTLSPSALPDIMSEIDLLKNLNHPNIVKYKGFARDKDSLFIVLEYCENGSLQTILKKFGKFPESLVAVYISQVLEGLIYLHDQGVVHRDIKGANILTNKDGSVKLADFGVSSKTGGGGAGDVDNEVVGSPYWMAPEVIEQSGATTASDIWSVGCVVVELLEGRPPYGDLAPMQALWRIVQDESMRIPEGASPKDPNLRISAKKLLKHPWMHSARRNLDNTSPQASQPHSRQPSTASKPVSNQAAAAARTPSGEAKLREKSVNPVVPEKKEIGVAGTIRGKKPLTVYDEAVQKVQEWNEALNAGPKPTGTVRRVPPTTSARPAVTTAVRPPSTTFAVPPLPSKGSADSLTAQASTSAHPSPAHPTGLIGKNQNASAALTRAKEFNKAEQWDDDFADVSFSKLGHRRTESSMSEDPDQMTLKPFKSPEPIVKLSFTGRPRVEASTSRAIPETVEEDYSDLGIDEDQQDLESKFANLKLKGKSRKGILHPDDLRKVKTLAPSSSSSSSTPVQPPKPIRTLSTPETSKVASSSSSSSFPIASQYASTPARRRVSPNLGPPQSPRLPTRSPPASRQDSLRAGLLLDEGVNDVEVELQKYQEQEEDWEDMFGDDAVGETLGTRTSTSLQLTRRSNRSWRSAEDDEQDPFAGLDDDFDMSEDIEANLLRDKRATLCGKIEKLVAQITPGNDQLKGVCDELLGLLEATKDLGLEGHFAACHGMLAVLEVLESRISRDVAVRLLKIVNFVVELNVDMLESFCLIGGIPVVIPFTSKKHPLETRLEASRFIHNLTLSPLTLQMFISCRGLRILVELLDEDYISNRQLILSALEGIGSVFDLQSPTPRNDFCRMFVREGILDPISTALLAILHDAELNPSPSQDTKGKGKAIDADGSVNVNVAESQHAERVVTVILLFCQVAQADTRVREAFANRTIVIRLLKACDLLPRKLLVTAIKSIKHLSTSPQLIEVLQNSNAMEILVGLLGKTSRGLHSNEICSNIFQTIYSMCRLSKARQEEAASSGIIPLLKRVILQKSPLKQFALPILCDLANAGKASRRLLWHNDGLKLYLGLLEDPYWRVSALDAILAWAQDETARVEDVLVEKAALDDLVKCFVQATAVSFEGILDPFLKLLRLSSGVTSAISTPTFFRRLSDALDKSGKAVTKLNLLRITRVVCEHHPDRRTLVERFGLADIVERLAKQDEAVLVRELAKEITPILLFGNTALRNVGLEGAEGSDRLEGRVALGATGMRVASTMRRTTSETVLPLGRDRPAAVTTATMAKANVVPGPSTAGRSLARSTIRDDEVHLSSAPVTQRITSSQRERSRLLEMTPGEGGKSSSLSTTNSTSDVKSKEKSIVSSTPSTGERPKHKRKISRSQLREVQWQTDENGRLKSVRVPSRTT